LDKGGGLVICECRYNVHGKKIARNPINAIKDLLQKIMKRELELFGHIARMNNSRKIRSVVMGYMYEDNRKGRPYRE